MTFSLTVLESTFLKCKLFISFLIYALDTDKVTLSQGFDHFHFKAQFLPVGEKQPGQQQ